MSKVKRIQRKEFNDALRKLASNRLQAKVGFFESAHYPDGTSIAYVAAIQEFGYGPIPPRSFVRSTIAEKKNGDWKLLMRNNGKRIVNGKMTPADALESMALLAEGDMRKKITEINSPPLSQVTLQLRKWKSQGVKIGGKQVGWAAALVNAGVADTGGVSTKPLNDTGAMLAHLTSAVTEK